MNESPFSLEEASFRAIVAHLADRHSDLAGIVSAHGSPPFWVRPPGFPTLIHIILEQQVSLASAQAAFDKLRALTGPLTPPAFLALDDDALRAAGFSRQKTRYCRIAAEAVRDGVLDLDGLTVLPDEEARRRLTALVGIGPWTADIYLQMALRRPDIWPVGDLALRGAVMQLKGLPARPDTAAMETFGEAWRPYRTVAASILWHGYLSWP